MDCSGLKYLVSIYFKKHYLYNFQKLFYVTYRVLYKKNVYFLNKKKYCFHKKEADQNLNNEVTNEAIY